MTQHAGYATAAKAGSAGSASLGAAAWASFARLTTGQKVAVLATVITLIGRQLLIINVETVVLVATGSFGAFVYSRFGDAIGAALDGRGVGLMADLQANADAQAAHVRAMAAVARARTAWHRARALAGGSTLPVLQAHTASARPALTASARAYAFVAGALARPLAARDRVTAYAGAAWAAAARLASAAAPTAPVGAGAPALTGMMLEAVALEELRAL